MYEEFSRQTFVIWQQNMLIAWVDPTRIQVKLSSFPQLRQGTMTAEKKKQMIKSYIMTTAFEYRTNL